MMNLITFLLGLSSALSPNAISEYQKTSAEITEEMVTTYETNKYGKQDIGISSNQKLSREENAAKAEKIFQQAESYYNEAINELDPNNEQKALTLYNEAAGLGHVRAQIRLAEIYWGYISTKTVESPNRELVSIWLALAVEHDKTGRAAYMFAQLLEEQTGWERDIAPSLNKKIFDYYQQSANLGYKDAFFQVAYRYEHSEGTEKSVEKAFEYYKRAADTGDYLSFERVGRMYQKGIGTKQDFAKAYEYYTKIDEVFADNEEYEPNPTIIFYLGEMYRDGEYVKQNKQQALEHFTMACEYEHDVESDSAACEALEQLKNKSSQ